MIAKRHAEACAETYEDMVPILKELARTLARKYNLDREELESQARTHFLEAYDSYNHNKGSIRNRVRTLVCHRLLSEARTHFRRNRILRRTAVDLDTLPRTAQNPDRYEMGRLTARVGDDARLVLALLFDGHPDFDEAVRNDPNPNPASVRGLLREWLHDRLGWNRSRTFAAFAEISKNI